MAKPMRVLVVGAGVLGSVLAHSLIRAGRDVTLLCRGEWKRAIDERGLTIRHYLQMRTTVDRVRTLDHLAADDVYDMVFVVMQWTQIDGVLDQIAHNRCKRVVFVGNNMDATATLVRAGQQKDVCFGFQGAGGRRDHGRVISVHPGLSITVGGLHGALSGDMLNALTALFEGSGYQLKLQDNMDAWLKCHAAFILPVCGLIYKHGGKLPKSTRSDVAQVMDAAMEAFSLLKRRGYPIVPARGETDIADHRGLWTTVFWLAFKTPVGRLVASDHAMSAVEEMLALNRAFEALRKPDDPPMPAWDALQQYMNR